MNTAVIFLAGEIKDYSVIKKYTEQADFVICADGGTRHADYMNVIPDMIIGDMDSIDPDLLGKYIGKGVKTRLFKTEKDETDSQLAVDIAFEQGFKDIVLLGAFGSLPDHTLANVMLLEYIRQKKGTGKIVTDNAELSIVRNCTEFDRECFNRISLIPLTEKVSGITTAGLKYKLLNDVLYRADTRGISNRFEEERVRIKVQEGVLLLVKVREETD